MFRIDLGRTGNYCDGLNRRSFLQVGVAGMASLGLSQVMRARAESGTSLASKKNTKVILIWLDGGPGHMDMYDMKPNAPAEIRGTLDTIQTTLPGVRFTEVMRCLARQMRHVALVRSYSHDSDDHFISQGYALSGRRVTMGTFLTEPNVGAIVNKLHQELKAVVASPEGQQQIIGFGMQPFNSPSPDELKTFLQTEIQRWGKVVQQAGLAGSE